MNEIGRREHNEHSRGGGCVTVVIVPRACKYVEIYVYCAVTFVALVENFYVKTSFRMT